MPLRIGALSYNIEKLQTSPKLQYTKIIELSPDIYVEMTQEDQRNNKGSDYSSSLIDKEILRGNQYVCIFSIALNEVKVEQNIILKLFVKLHIAKGITITGGRKPVSPKESRGAFLLGAQLIARKAGLGYGYSKGMVYAKVAFKDSSEMPILFVNMHLPMDGKLNNLGLNYRKSVLADLLEKLLRSGQIYSDTRIIIGGDLNFRMNMNGVNQLNTLLSNVHTPFEYYLKELPFPNGEKKLTCKFISHNKTCRTRKMPKNNLRGFLKNVQNTCGNAKRIPSRCDRFLISKPPITKVNVLMHEAVYLLPEADHNGLAACFDLL